MTTELQTPLLPSIRMSAGQVSVGRSESRTMIRKLHPAVLPLVSTALQITRLVPIGIMAPLAGVQVSVAPEQLSRTVAE